MTDMNTITHYITTDNMKAEDISFAATKHPAPKGRWWVTNKLANAQEITLHPAHHDEMKHIIVNNMRTQTNKAGKEIELGKEEVPLFCPVSWATKDGNRQSDSVTLSMHSSWISMVLTNRQQGVCSNVWMVYVILHSHPIRRD